MVETGLRNAATASGQRDETKWGSLTWLANAQIGNADGLTLGRVTIRAGSRNPRHRHDTCEELLYLLAGKLEHSVGDQMFTLEPGDTLTIPAGQPHHAISVGEVDADMIVAYDSAQRDFVLVDED